MAAALVDEALARLAERSLVTVSLDGQAIIMHRVVMLVVRAEMARRQRLTAVCRLAASVLDARARAVSQDRLAVRDVPEQVSALAVKQAVEALFKVKVSAVRTANVVGKERRRGKFTGFKPDWKKAYVRLKAGQKLPEYVSNL